MKPIEVEKLPLKGYSVAPYNFVSFPKKAVIRYKKPSELPAHNDFKNREGKDLLSGTIEYTIEAMTPIMVADGKDDKNAYFFTNARGDYAIPGNTLRGLIRTNCQILSFSNVVNAHEGDNYSESEIENSRFLFRDVAGNGALAKKYKDILDIDNIKRISRSLRAGYIVNENNKYYIEESEKLNDIRNYFRIAELDLRKAADKDIVRDIKFMYKESLKDYEKKLKSLNKSINSRNKKESREANRERYGILRRNKNNNYKPYCIEISFSLDSKNVRITKLGPKDRYGKKGYLLSGGFIDGKMSHYIVPAPNPKLARIPISEEDITSYKDDLILTKKMEKASETIVPGYEFFDLPRRGERKPVFFINTTRLHFGFTPYLRMFYSKTILDGLEPSYKDLKGISYTDGIFGFINRKFKRGNDLINYNYKSRVSFEDAVIEGEAIVDKDSTMLMLLAGPKPTSYNLYLKQDLDAHKKELAIYEDNFQLRGIKQYWLKDYVEKLDLEESNMTFKIHPLKEGSKFKGRIHFRNLEEDELGLLLWALRLEESSYQTIGMAKPHGFGRVKVKDIKLEIEDLEKKYKDFSFDYTRLDEVDKYINSYKEEFSQRYLNGAKIEEQLPIKEFFHIKKTVISKEDSPWYRYMTLDEFKDRKVLPSILEYADNVKRDNEKFNKPRGNQPNQRRNKDNKDTRNNSNDKEFGNTLADAFKNFKL